MNVKKYCWLIFIFLWLFKPAAHAQDLSVDSLVSEFLDTDEDMIDMLMNSGKFQFLYARTNYDSKTLFAGRDIGFQKFNGTGQLAYFHSSGISLGAAAVYYGDLVPRVSTALLMIGYNGLIAKSPDYRYRVSYDRYFFPKGDSIAKSSINSSIGLGFTVDKKIAGARFDYSLLIGSKTYSQLLAAFYGDFLLARLGKSNHIKFEPELAFHAGKDRALVTKLGVVPGVRPIRYTIIEQEQEKFGWMNTELQLPVTVSYNNFDFELGFNINFPRAVANPSETYKRTTYFNLSIGYLVDLNKY